MRNSANIISTVASSTCQVFARGLSPCVAVQLRVLVPNVHYMCEVLLVQVPHYGLMAVQALPAASQCAAQHLEKVEESPVMAPARLPRLACWAVEACLLDLPAGLSRLASWAGSHTQPCAALGRGCVITSGEQTGRCSHK